MWLKLSQLVNKRVCLQRHLSFRKLKLIVETMERGVLDFDFDFFLFPFFKPPIPRDSLSQSLSLPQYPRLSLPTACALCQRPLDSFFNDPSLSS